MPGRLTASRVDVNLPLQIATLDASIGRIATFGQRQEGAGRRAYKPEPVRVESARSAHSS